MSMLCFAIVYAIDYSMYIQYDIHANIYDIYPFNFKFFSDIW